jgi:hypothetical protein
MSFVLDLFVINVIWIIAYIDDTCVADDMCAVPYFMAFRTCAQKIVPIN